MPFIQNSSELEPALLEVIRDVLPIWKRAVYHKQLISFMIEHFTATTKMADELGYEELTKEVIAFIDLTNLSTMARGIQHQNSNFYQPYFLALAVSQRKNC